MKRNTTIFSRKLPRSIHGLCAFFILVIYLLGNIATGDFHHLLHPSEIQVEHSPEQEADLCHVTLFHSAAPEHCSHEFHVTDKTTCELCDVILHHPQMIESFEIAISSIPLSAFNEPLLHLEISSVSLNLSSRGPPAVF